METINWGIIGCGDVAEVKSGPAFQKVKNSKLVAVMRRNAAKAKDFAKRHNVPLWYDSVDDLLNNETINAVYIATPPSSHLAIAKKCLDANKFVYLEKPITLDFEEAESLQNLLKTNDKLVVAHYRRNLPAFKKVKELIETNSIGKIQYAYIQFLQSSKNTFVVETTDNWRLDPAISGGGYFHDIAPHLIDLMYYYFGEIENATGFSSSSKNNKIIDIVNGIIQFKNGVQFNGVWNFNTVENAEKDECIIYGENGTIVFSLFGATVTLKTNDTDEIFTFQHPVNIQEPMISQTVSYFLGQGDNPCSIENGLVVMNIIDAFTR